MHRAEADDPEAEDDRDVARLRLAEAGRAQGHGERLNQRAGPVGDRVGQLEDRLAEERLRHQHAVGEGAGDAVADVEPAPGLAQVDIAREAAVALAARRERADRDAVAVAEAVHAGCREDRPGELVAEDLAGPRPEAALVGAQVRAADAALGHLDQRLPIGRDGLVDLGEVEALGFDPLGSTHAGIRASRVPACARFRPGRCGPRQARVNGRARRVPPPVRILRVPQRGDYIEAVMFDMDGTLLDSWDALLGAYQDATTEILGTPFPVERADIDHIIQLSARDAFPALAGGDLELAKRIQAAFGASYRSRSGQISLYDGVKETLVALRDQGLKLGIATSKSRVRLDPDLEQTGIGELLDATICGDEVPAAKPDPAPIVAIMGMLGVEPGAALYVGDGANDVLAAHRAGVQAVGAGYGFHPRACREAGPEHWIEAPQALPALVAGARGAG